MRGDRERARGVRADRRGDHAISVVSAGGLTEQLLAERGQRVAPPVLEGDLLTFRVYDSSRTLTGGTARLWRITTSLDGKIVDRDEAPP